MLAITREVDLTVDLIALIIYDVAQSLMRFTVVG